MRIKEELKGWGDFWLPSTPDTQIPGILSISAGESIQLELFGVFGTLDEPKPMERIVGHVRGMGFVTLDDCYYKNRLSSVDTSRTFDDISKSLIDVMKVFKGVAYREGEIPRFKTLTFSVEGIDDWVDITGIKVDHQFRQHTATISYELPENITLKLDNGMELLILFSWQPPPFSLVPKEAKIAQKTYFHLVSQDARELDEFISLAKKLTTFLCFALFEELIKNLIEQCPKERQEWLRSKLTHANEVSLRKRIQKLIEPFKDLFGNKEKRKKLVNRIVDTRNNLTHHHSERENINDLWVLCQKMEVLFRLLFLQMIGFSQEEIRSIVSDCNELRQTLSF